MAQRSGQPHPRRRSIAIAASVVVAAGIAGGVAVWNWAGSGLPSSTPSCSWALEVRGTADTAQVGLVRCYVRAVARHDLKDLQALALPDPPVRVGAAQVAHSADARIGVATATFTQNPNDSADATVEITYRDGARDVVSMQYANPAAESWRLDIGSLVTPSGKVPTLQPRPASGTPSP
jgi:hypothetical protein